MKPNRRSRPRRCGPFLFTALACFMGAGSADGSLATDNLYTVDGLIVDRLRTDPEPSPEPVQKGVALDLHGFKPEISAKSPETIPEGGALQRRAEAAAEYFQEGRWEAALREYQALVRANPGHMPFIERAAVSATLSGHFGVADGYFAQIIEEKPSHVGFLVGWGGVLIRLHRFEQAGEVLQRALALEPDNIGLQFNRLILAIAEGRDVEPTWHWESLGLNDIWNLSAWLVTDRPGLRDLLPKNGFAKLTYQLIGLPDSTALDAVSADLRAADLAIRGKHWSDALAHLSSLQAAGLDRYGLELERARCLVETGEYEQGLATLTTLRERYPDAPDVVYNMGYTRIRMKDYETALFLLEDVLELLPGNPEVRFARVCALIGAGHEEEAWTELTQLAQSYPERISSWTAGDEPYLNVIRADPRYLSLPGVNGS